MIQRTNNRTVNFVFVDLFYWYWIFFKYHHPLLALITRDDFCMKILSCYVQGWCMRINVIFKQTGEGHLSYTFI